MRELDVLDWAWQNDNKDSLWFKARKKKKLKDIWSKKQNERKNNTKIIRL